MKRSSMLIPALVILIAGLGYYYYEGMNKANSNELILNGNIDIRESSLAFRTGDRLAEIFVEEGDAVKAGDKLARLETTSLELDILTLKAQIAAQSSVVNKLHNGVRPEELNQAAARRRLAEANASYASDLYARKEDLHEAGAISTQELDLARKDKLSALASLNEATEALREAENGYRPEDIAEGEANLKALEARLANSEYLLKESTLIAPTDGVIRSRLLEVGDMAAPNTPVFRLALNSKKWARVYVAETDLGNIYEGQEATITTDTPNVPALKGQVGYISEVAEFTPKTVQTAELRTALVYEVRVYVEDEGNILRLGMPVTVSIKR